MPTKLAERRAWPQQVEPALWCTPQPWKAEAIGELGGQLLDLAKEFFIEFDRALSKELTGCAVEMSREL